MSGYNGVAENDGRENDGREIAGHKIAGYEANSEASNVCYIVILFDNFCLCNIDE